MSAALNVTCGVCGAVPGQPCTGVMRAGSGGSHAVRVAAAKRARISRARAGRAACDLCGAPQNGRCELACQPAHVQSLGCPHGCSPEL